MIMPQQNTHKSENSGHRICCFDFGDQHFEQKQEKYSLKFKSNNNKYRTERISLAKNRRAATCKLANKTRNETTNRLDTSTELQTAKIRKQFDHSLYYTPKQVNHHELYSFHSGKQMSFLSKNNNQFPKKAFQQHSFINKSEKIVETQKTQSFYESSKQSKTHYKRVNFLYKSPEILQPPQIVQFSAPNIGSQNIRKFNPKIDKKLQFCSPANNPSTKIDNNERQHGLIKEASKPITLNYSSRESKSNKSNISDKISDSEHNLNLNDLTIAMDYSRKKIQSKSMQMTNLPTQRCANSTNVSMKNSNGFKFDKQIDSLDQRSLTGLNRDSNKGSSVAISIAGSDHSSGKQSVVVDLNLQQDEPLSPHIMKIKSERKSSENKSQIIVLSEVKL